MAADTRIRTERLRLRSWRTGDARSFDKTCNTPAVMRWLGGVQSRAAVKADVRYFSKAEARDGFTFWVVEKMPERRFLGFCGILKINESDCPFRGALEIGWRIREDAWRHGYAFEAASATLDYVFNRVDAATVVSRAAAGNRASTGLMRKLGMQRRRDLDYRPRGENDKLEVYSISAEQW